MRGGRPKRSSTPCSRRTRPRCSGCRPAGRAARRGARAPHAPERRRGRARASAQGAAEVPRDRAGAATSSSAWRARRCRARASRSRFDLAELGGFNYESGLVFAAFAAGSPDALARGGRYDEVGAVLRARAPGDRLHHGPAAARGARRATRRAPRAILAPCVEDAALAEADRAGCARAGEVVIVDLPGHDAAQRTSWAATARSQSRRPLEVVP